MQLPCGAVSSGAGQGGVAGPVGHRAPRAPVPPGCVSPGSGSGAGRRPRQSAGALPAPGQVGAVAPGPGRAAGTAGRASPRLSPHRLLWPKSKAFDHLYSVGEKLLENFPVQATLFFYEDSDSEEEEEEDEEEEGDEEEEEATGDVTGGHPRYAGSPGSSRPA